MSAGIPEETRDTVRRLCSEHGNMDGPVPYDQAVRLDTALPKAGVPSYFVAVKGAAHGDFGTATDGRAEQFYAKYLLGKDVNVSTETIDRRKP